MVEDYPLSEAFGVFRQAVDGILPPGNHLYHIQRQLPQMRHRVKKQLQLILPILLRGQIIRPIALTPGLLRQLQLDLCRQLLLYHQQILRNLRHAEIHGLSL